MPGDADAVVKLEVFFQYPFHLIELAVMADAVVFRRSRDSRLFRVELPYVEIEDKRFGVPIMPPFHGLAHKRVGDLAKIIASRNRQQADTEISRRIRKFPYHLSARMYLVGDAFCLLGFFVW